MACAEARASQKPQNPDAGSGAVKANKGNVAYVDDLDMQPPYENSVNPFLSHIEQASIMRRNPTHNHRKHLMIKLSKNKINAVACNEYDDVSKNHPLEVDPERPHFIDEDTYVDATSDDNKGFGDEEKNFKNMLDVLFSSDY
ncbi:unnamed protein product [Orchesella dallaii]|uniref:Uncharacterized protein n=1 Tax=Orchesella dallaii TaxID=48710 RepID=A0ABP1RK97_9HEXA